MLYNIVYQNFASSIISQGATSAKQRLKTFYSREFVRAHFED